MPTNTVTPERRVELINELSSCPRVSEGYQCTDAGCKYHSKPMVAKHPERMQEHYQKAHISGEGQDVDGSHDNSYDQMHERDETTILSAETPTHTHASHPVDYTSTGKKVGPPQVLRDFLSALFTGPDDLREANLYQTFNGPFFVGSFVNKKLFRSYIPEYTNSPSYNCFMLASSIMWLAKIDPSTKLSECLDRQLQVAKNIGDDDTYFLQYRWKSNDAFYDFLYGLYVKTKIDPEHDWFTRPESIKMAQLLYNLAGHEEQQGMCRYHLKTQNMLPLVEERKIDKTELTYSVWTDALEEWLKNYGEAKHLALGDYLGEIMEREVRRIKLET
ncbi:hypothetical protein AC579_6521 [Pseudocercospora musae]|uniref:Uncharacterized protein n=1 Tax=Pseudocercospora musae TaxID=113226 RepID=A0A139I3P2_9PEZI|nr:hypothetical protein AC579_6521 [Pseudocercospora musae]